MRDEDFNQDIMNERPPARDRERWAAQIEAVLARLPGNAFEALRPTNGLATDPRHIERMKALRSLARSIAAALR